MPSPVIGAMLSNQKSSFCFFLVPTTVVTAMIESGIQFGFLSIEGISHLLTDIENFTDDFLGPEEGLDVFEAGDSTLEVMTPRQIFTVGLIDELLACCVEDVVRDVEV